MEETVSDPTETDNSSAELEELSDHNKPVRSPSETFSASTTTIFRSAHSLRFYELPAQSTPGHSVGTFTGVFVPCYDNIVNIVYFSRLGYVIGSEGGLATIIGLLVSFVLVFITVLSLSAFSTNGEIEMGGAYYLLSRTIGPNTGAVCGFCLIVASLLGGATSSLGFSEAIVNLYLPYAVTGSKEWDMRIIAMLLSVLSGYLAQYGFPVRLAMFYFINLGILAYILGCIFPSVTQFGNDMGCSNSRFNANMHQESSSITHLFSTFSIIFPAFGGILAGSNSSGSLKRPQFSIPAGSISSLIIGTFVYAGTALLMTGCNTEEQLNDVWNNPMIASSIWWPLVFAATGAASIAKGVTGLGAGPMVMRSMANDHMIHEFFGNWSRVFGTSVAVLLCLWGDFNTISSLSSYFFLICFSIINFSLFKAFVAQAPSFRPHFWFYSPTVALIGSLACLVAIFFINWQIALACIVILGAFYIYISHKGFHMQWGSFDDSSAYNNGLKAALRLQHVPPHEKLYRPNVVCLIDSPIDQHHDAVVFLDQMLKSKGLAMVARHFPIDTPLSVIQQTISDNQETLMKYHVFFEAVIAKDKHEALTKVMLLSGLGALRPDVVFSEFDETLSAEAADFIGDVLDRHWSVIILRHPAVIEDFGNIDLWWLSDDGGLCPLIASILSGSGRTLRIMAIAQTELGESVEELNQKMKHLCRTFRLKGKVNTIPYSTQQKPTQYARRIWSQLHGNHPIEQYAYEITERYMILADLIRKYSSNSLVAVVSLPVPKKHHSTELYMEWLSLISSIQIPVLFVRGNGTHALSWQV